MLCFSGVFIHLIFTYELSLGGKVEGWLEPTVLPDKGGNLALMYYVPLVLLTPFLALFITATDFNEDKTLSLVGLNMDSRE